MIDTPGHVDFSYEVSRSLAACEGVLLVIDATQGIQAQTIANLTLAMQHNLTVIPVINKIDLPSANPDFIKEQLEDVLQIESSDAVLVSAKEGIGINELMEALVQHIPSPNGDSSKKLQALLFDAWYDPYRGVIILVKVQYGSLKIGDGIMMMATGNQFVVEELGTFDPKEVKGNEIQAGEVGYLVANIKELDQTKVGDTITHAKNPSEEPLPGYKEVKPMVFSGLYPISGDDYEDLRDALKKLTLNDASFSYEAETSTALGFGFRCGFLGLLHMEIVRERIEREYKVDLLTTAPTVIYKVVTTDGKTLMIDNPCKLQEQKNIDHLEEPFVIGTIIVPEEYIGVVMTLVRDRRGVQKKNGVHEPRYGPT
jgi:GTP-binding protein LepA